MLRIYSWWLILSARTTVISCVIPARIKSACRVFSFWVRRPARQRLSLMWLISLSTTVLIYRYHPILRYRVSYRDKHEDLFRIDINHTTTSWRGTGIFATALPMGLLGRFIVSPYHLGQTNLNLVTPLLSLEVHSYFIGSEGSLGQQGIPFSLMV